MKLKSIVLGSALLVSACYAVWRYTQAHRIRITSYITTQRPHIGPITEQLHVTGVIEIPELLKIGSLQPGLVQEVLVKENQHIEKGQLLAVIQTSRGTTDLQSAYHRLKRAVVEHDYQKKQWLRYQKLHQAGHVSQDTYEQVEKEYQKALHETHIESATAKRAKIEFEATRIKAPADGIVTAVYATRGMVANDVNNTILFEIAPNITLMQAVFDIDESMIGQVRQGVPAKICVTSYPDVCITTTIQQVSFVPKGNVQDPVWYFKAQAPVDNGAGLLRPGMVVHGTLSINHQPEALLIPDSAFGIHEQTLLHITQACDVPLIKPNEQEKKGQALWILGHNGITQKWVQTGLFDGTWWQVCTGLTPDEEVITNVKPCTRRTRFSLGL